MYISSLGMGTCRADSRVHICHMYIAIKDMCSDTIRLVPELVRRSLSVWSVLQ